MDQKQIAKQMMEFNKTAFDNTFNAMTVLQDQTEKLVFHFLEKAQWFPQEGKTVINDWVKAYKKGREDFKASADAGFQKVADYFAATEKDESGKIGKKINQTYEPRNNGESNLFPHWPGMLCLTTREYITQ